MSDYIPFAIQEDILKRLPTKSLLQFRSVSKAWKSLIDSSRFVVDYSLNHTHQQHLLVRYLREKDVAEKFVSIVDDETFPVHKSSLPVPIAQVGQPTILGSSQGLFCVYMYHLDPRNSLRIMYTAVLWNPSIRKTVAVDVDTPDSDLVIIGFGVCPHTSDPKLVKISSITSTNLRQVEVYTLSSRAWRSLPTIKQPRNSIHLSRDQIAIDGFMYWLATATATATDVNISMRTIGFEPYNLVVSYDMTSDSFMEISLPDSIAAPNNNVVISKLKESLIVVEIVKDAGKHVYGVWMMEHDVNPNSFTNLFTINSPEASVRTILGFRKNNEAIFAMCTDCKAHDVFVHELHSECIKYTRFSGNGCSYSARSYMETLLLLDH